MQFLNPNLVENIYNFKEFTDFLLKSSPFTAFTGFAAEWSLYVS